MAEANGDDYLLVAAIDFGTTYSGYAFSTKMDFKTDPKKICSKVWYAGTGNISSLKTSTCVLYKPNGTFHSFGFQAEDKYTELAEVDQHRDWFFFSRFKMHLYKMMRIRGDIVLEDELGKPMSALKVFSDSIGFLKDDLMKECRDKIPDVKDSDVKWVLTVSAIWTDAAKAFMRNAAKEAGIDNDRLLICLEPEAAALYVKETSLKDREQAKSGDSYQAFCVGAKYLVCDAGGGTVDVTVQEVQPGGGIKELYMANGGDWGGTKVDDALEYVLCELFGEDVITKLSKEEKADFLEIFRGFEMKKRTIGPETDSSVFIRIPARLNEIYKQKNGGKDMASILRTSAAESKVSKIYRPIFAANKVNLPAAVDERRNYIGFKRDKLELKPFVIKQLFQDSTTAISTHLKQILDEVRHVDTILLVGGYSESPMLRECIRRQFPRKRVIIPQESGLAVLKGAVIYGHNPNVFSQRISKYTYGIHVSEPYIEGEHNPDYKFVNDKNEVYCKNMFYRHIQKGESVTIGKTHSSERLGFCRHKKRQTCRVYCSTDPDPKYTTDPGCTKLGKVVLDIPLSDLDIYKDEATIKFSFSGTEFEVKAVFNKTGKTAKSFFRFET